MSRQGAKKPKRVFDPNKQPAHECPLLHWWVDQTGVEENAGSCSVYPKLVNDPEADLVCPKRGPRGGNLGVAPDDCPLRTYELILVRKAKGRKS
jgi:hypothetical protein